MPATDLVRLRRMRAQATAGVGETRGFKENPSDTFFDSFSPYAMTNSARICFRYDHAYHTAPFHSGSKAAGGYPRSTQNHGFYECLSKAIGIRATRRNTKTMLRNVDRILQHHAHLVNEVVVSVVGPQHVPYTQD